MLGFLPFGTEPRSFLQGHINEAYSFKEKQEIEVRLLLAIIFIL